MNTLKYYFSIFVEILDAVSGAPSGDFSTKDYFVAVALVVFLCGSYLLSMLIVGKFAGGLGINIESKGELTFFSIPVWILLIALTCGLFIVGELVFTNLPAR